MAGNRPRWMLHIQAEFWRFLMGIGMLLHKLARPLPPSPSFDREIEATVSPLPGKFKLFFYVPKDYHKQRKLKGGKRYPCVINFHGGGFCLGKATDDARWAGLVVDQLDAVVVSVAYRLAPEFPFPTAVEDGADAVLYLAQHADELLLDSQRFALSGFSSGGNMSFTVPLCLQGELQDGTPSASTERVGNVPAVKILEPPTTIPSGAFKEKEASKPPTINLNGSTLHVNGSTVKLASTPDHLTPVPTHLTATSTAPTTSTLTPNSTHLAPSSGHPLTRPRIDRIAMLRQTGASALSLVSSYKENGAVSVATQGSSAIARICGIVSFYPPTDYTQTRAQRRATCARTDHQLPAVFTELFDDSYLQPPSLDLSHPWLSPGVAPTNMLVALPDDIVMFCCEWDMLLAEGERFRDKLQKDLGKRVGYHMVPGVPHGWDKAPNPLRESPGARQQYLIACDELKRMFSMPQSEGDKSKETLEV